MKRLIMDYDELPDEDYEEQGDSVEGIDNAQ
jgi:hypothetical protein